MVQNAQRKNRKKGLRTLYTLGLSAGLFVWLFFTAPITTEAAPYWEYTEPILVKRTTPQSISSSTTLHEGWTMLDYAKHSPHWEIGSELEEGNVCITPDPDTSYWSGNSTVYRYAEGTKIVFPENQNKRITTTEGHHVYQSKKELLEVPVSHWEVAGEAVACHTSNIKNAPSESVVYYGGLPFRQVSYGKYDYKKMVPCGRGG